MINIKSLQDKLQQVIQNNLMVGYHFEAISSIINYPAEYELGRKSVHMECKSCGMKPKHIIDIESIDATGHCFKCDELSAEYYHEGLMEMRAEMEANGFDPDNPNDVADFQEKVGY